MITVETWKDSKSGTWVRITGHAAVSSSPDKENVQVCAGVSTLMATLTVLAEDAETKEGNPGSIDGTGYMKCRVPEKLNSYGEFVMAGITLIRDEYPGFIQFNRPDSWLPQ